MILRTLPPIRPPLCHSITFAFLLLSDFPSFLRVILLFLFVFFAPSLLHAVQGVGLEVLEVARPELQPTVYSVIAGLGEPRRLAIAGRVKAGKSTLVNALVGRMVAPTRAGECTKVVERGPGRRWRTRCRRSRRSISSTA